MSQQSATSVWETRPERLGLGRERYWLRSRLYAVESNLNGTWAAVDPEGRQIISHMKLEQARKMAETFELTATGKLEDDGEGLWDPILEDFGDGSVRYWLRSSSYGIESLDEGATWCVVYCDGRPVSRPMSQDSAKRLAERFERDGHK